MKKGLFVLSFALLVCAKSMAWDLVPLTVSIDVNNQPLTHGHPKTPIESPKVYIEDYTLSFGVNHPEYILIIKDEDDNVVYTTTVYSTQTDVILPSTLSGNYEINLVMGNWLFTGWINL